MNIDYKVRLKNRNFVLSTIAFIVLLVKTFTKYELPSNFDVLVNTGLSILTALGILVDPTTSGLADGIKVESVIVDKVKIVE